MNTSFESAYACDKEGNILIQKKGQATSVSFMPEETAKMKDAIFTHNHPRGWKAPEGAMGRIGNSFSPGDVLVAINNDVAEMRAVTPNFTFSMKRPANGWGLSFENAKKEINRIDAEITKDYADRIRNRTTTVNKASITHYHRLWKQFADKYGIEYTKAKTR